MTDMYGCCGRYAVVCVLLSWISEASAGEAWVSAGVGGSGDALYSYSGLTIAPKGSLNAAGLRARLWGKT